MKILITTDWYTPAINGVVTSVKNLQRELERRGHEVRILTLSQNLRSWSRDGVTAVGSIDAGRIYPGARLRTAMAGRWVRELLDWHPDVIHSQCEFSTFFLARRIAEEAMGLRAAQIYVAHNHVSNLAIPSQADWLTTDTLRGALRPIGIELIDHLVFVDGDMVSLKDSEHLKGLQYV